MSKTDLHLAPTQASAAPQPPPRRDPVPFDPASVTSTYIGRYFIKRLLGKGGFGHVFLAADEQLDRNVAIKVPHSQVVSHSLEIQMHLAEARAVANLDHPHIVPVYDVGSTPEFPFFVVSKFIDGHDLATLMRQRRYAPRQAAEIIASVAEGLSCAHKQGLIHRDVKPGNILIDQEGKAFIVDFGIALREHEGASVLEFAGTPAYMSPEQVRGEGHRVDERSDIFSLGVILYELLAGCHPFQASSQEELLKKIAATNPLPASQWNASVPLELDRICLRALEKLATDRYSTAKEMAEDLWRYSSSDSQQTGLINSFPTIRQPFVSERGDDNAELVAVGGHADSIRIAPKGLRSYDASDSNFFLELLPGPRDHEGLPESIRFWKSRIESTDESNSFAVGLIYGPSGCGKSSFVKAGLLPRLHRSVISIYVEASPEETESRLRQRLQKISPTLPPDGTLTEIMTAIRRGKGAAGNCKVLIVIDQFEQWLHANRTNPQSELINALRQCDGIRLQCVIMVRDDFWMPVTRFVRELESRFWDGQNSGTLDLFSLRHAETVLAAFGRAYGNLPERSAEMTEDQRAFLSQAVHSLAEDGKVMCIRLALFADMLKARPWTSLSLKQMGGAQGVGVAFLEETFGSTGASPEHRFHQAAVRRILTALLPESGTDIKGTMRSYVELQEIAGYLDRPNEFRELIRILDREVRLITPTDPVVVDGVDPFAIDPSEKKYSLKYYQLTHDYLVPSLRSWLTFKQKATPKGRAELRLAERSAIWNALPEPRSLPNLFEFASIRIWTSPTDWTPAERRTMAKAAVFHGRRFVLIGLLVMLVTMWGFSHLDRLEQQQKENYARVLVKSLFTVPVGDVPKIVDELKSYEKWAVPMLQQEAREFEETTRERIRISLVLLNRDPSQVTYLVQRMLAAKTEDVPLIATYLLPYREQIEPGLWKTIAHPSDHGQLIRAAVALAIYAPNDARWDQYAGDVANALLLRSRASSKLWIDYLRPLSPKLVPPIQKSFKERQADRQAERPLMALALAEYLHQYPDELLQVTLLADDGSEFQPLFEKLRSWKVKMAPSLREIVKEPIDLTGDLASKIKYWKRIANAAVCLVEMGDRGSVRPLLQFSSDPSLRSLLIQRFNQYGVTFKNLSEWFRHEKDVSIRRALILAMGNYNETKLLREQRQVVTEKVRGLFLHDPDSGIHSAAEWMLRQWGAEELILPTEQQQSRQRDPSRLEEFQRSWFVNSQGQEFVVIRGPQVFTVGHQDELRNPARAVKLNHDFALATHEVTVSQFQRFRPLAIPHKERPWTGNHPMTQVLWYDAIAYCNWLNQQEGIPREQWCYEPNEAGEYAEGIVMHKNVHERSGYRLPEPEEWEFCCRAGTTTNFGFGDIDELLTQYGWSFANSANHPWPVGLLKPNEFGFFDMHGNVHEWTSEPAENSQTYEGQERTRLMYVACGGSFYQHPLHSRSYVRFHRTPSVVHPNFGLRPVKTMLSPTKN